MKKEELKEIKTMVMNYGDPIRGKILALVASVETLGEEAEGYKKHAEDFEEMYKQEHREKNELKRKLEALEARKA